MQVGGSDEVLLGLIDPDADRPEVAATMRALLSVVDGSSPRIDPIRVESDPVASFLERHRVSTVVPVDLVAASGRPRLRGLHLEAAAAQARIRSAASACLEVLGSARIETRVLKGLATADLDYPERRMRHTGDVDLAVAPDRLDDAVEILHRHGYRDHPNPFDPALLYGWTLDSPEGVEIDLHTRLFRRSPRNIDLVSDPGVELSSLPGRALATEQRLVHAAGHFIISPPGTRRMSGVLDISRLLARDDIDLDRARRYAALLGVESLVGAGIGVEAALSGRDAVLAELRSWRQPDWLERRTRLVARRQLILDHLGRYREVPVGDRLRYLPAWLLPSARQRHLLRRWLAESLESRTSRKAHRPPM